MDEHGTATAAEPGTPEGDAELLAAIADGDETAFGRLYDAWFDRSYDVALRIVREPDAAADVAQDAFLAAWRNLDGLEDRAAFGGWLLRITRNRALDHKRKYDRARPADDMTMRAIEATEPGARSAGADPEGRLASVADPVRVVEDAELQNLVWDAATALGDRDASLLDLHLRHGLTPGEIADELGIKPNAAHQSLHRLRDRLGAAVSARILWRGGRPACPELDAVLDEAGGARFDGDTAARVRRHAQGCEACTARQRTQLEPRALFAAVPVAVAPIALKAKAAAAMQAGGAPMSGSTYGPTDAVRSASGGPGASGGGRRGRHRAAVAALALVLVLAVVGTVLALTTRSLDDDSDLPTPTGEVGAIDTAAPGTGPGATAVPPGAPPPAVPDDPAPAGGPSIIAFSLSPTAIPPEAPSPTIVWSVDPAGSGTAELTGPNLLTTALTGSQPVCPGVVDSGVCVTPPGTYDYTLHAYEASGAEAEVRTITLVVG